MVTVIKAPTEIQAQGNKPKVIEEFVGRLNSNTSEVSIARMRSPEGWAEPGQTPAFTEYTVVVAGTLRVETRAGTVDVGAGHAIVGEKDAWIRYSTPFEGGAEYFAVCLPAFGPGTVNRDAR